MINFAWQKQKNIRLFMRFYKIKLFSTLLLLVMLASCHKGGQGTEDYPAYHNPLVAPLTEAISQNPDNAELWYQRSEALLQVQSPELARKDLQQALKLDTSNLKYWFALGQVNITLNDGKGAVLALNQLLEKAPNSGPAKLLLSQAYLLENKPGSAVREINSILEADSSYPGALYRLAQIKLFEKDTTVAVSILQRALQMRDNDYPASLLLAETFAAKHQLQAVQQFRLTFAMDTTDVAPLVAMGRFYEQEQQIVLAKKAYYECLVKDPDCTPALLNMGLLLMKEDSLEKALRQFNTAIQTRPNSAEAYYQKGICFEKLKQQDSARNAFRQALVFAPNDLKIKQAWKRNSSKSKS